jgi:lipopolysaccharide transport system ATP-binding protein
MNNAAVIYGEGLGKSYRKGALAEDVLLRDKLSRMLRSPLAALRPPRSQQFWALKNVSLAVREGEVLGLIGRNGAGKTTLLKILSRITRPTTGWAEIRGRVGSLLEVGTGFHPELSGRENTFLSGAILGMGKREIARKFDEIVEFAELRDFIDTPVKHYSSGMYVRLAFAVAAHLEPQILLVDEVLAVGDIKFQKKCLGKMGDVARAGRTVVLVSHQLNQIRRLSQRVLWIDGGQVRQDGPAAQVVSAYEAAMSAAEEDTNTRVDNGAARFLRWEIMSTDAMPDQAGDPHILHTAGPARVSFTVRIHAETRHGLHGIALFDSDRRVIWAHSVSDLRIPPGTHVLSHDLPGLPIRPGSYSWQVSLWDDHELLDMWDAVPDMIVAAESFQHQTDEWSGLLNFPSELSIGPANPSDKRADGAGRGEKDMDKERVVP